MKIKDLDPKKPLGGVRFRYPGDGQLYYWHSQWPKGVWGKKDQSSSQVFPLDVNALTDAMEWEVVKGVESSASTKPSATQSGEA